SFMKKVFPLRTCRRLHKKVCLEYDIGQCLGPCEKKVTDKEYRDTVGQLRAFLEGRKDDLIRSLEERMKGFSRKRQYEKALSIKNRIEALTAVQQLHDRSKHPIYGELDELQNALNMPSLPVTVECFDISDIGGQQAVGSMVTFVGGKPLKAGYRKYRIKNVEGMDDYAMVREAVHRRYSRLLSENKTLPDLVLIDGGRGHFSAAKDELRALGLGDLTVASIAKVHNHLYVEGRRQPIRLSPGSRLLLLIQRIRDEAHRFAITYHRKLRWGVKFTTEFKGIKGVGPAKEKLLMEKFGSASGVRGASVEELCEAGIDRRTARMIAKHFKNML
ncbi:MAG: helix-hairpin-helix domain-containing protein, partial [Candidatus Omnitrophota bacterium]